MTNKATVCENCIHGDVGDGLVNKFQGKRKLQNQTFEDYLQERHAKQYTGLDDQMPDAYDDWLENIDIQDIIKYAEEWAK